MRFFQDKGFGKDRSDFSLGPKDTQYRRRLVNLKVNLPGLTSFLAPDLLSLFTLAPTASLKLHAKHDSTNLDVSRFQNALKKLKSQEL